MWRSKCAAVFAPISPSHVWSIASDGNEGTKHGTYIYRTDDLSKPAFLIKKGPIPKSSASTRLAIASSARTPVTTC